MSNLLDDIRAESQPRGSRCSVSATLNAETIPAAVRADLAVALADPEHYTGGAIARALRRRDVDLAEGAIQRHRRGDCRCPRPAAS